MKDRQESKVRMRYCGGREWGESGEVDEESVYNVLVKLSVFIDKLLKITVSSKNCDIAKSLSHSSCFWYPCQMFV